MVRSPIRGIRAESVSSTEKPAARRAIVEPKPPAPAPVVIDEMAVPVFGAAERQLVFAYLATGIVVLFMIVALPALLGMVRNF